ncbi:MAG TPA: hypothetical protein VNO50_12770 [Pyrinomonadaceae bacterium]|nr:hypothetical protein [Pyrinomonadaceae bacterium]
MDRVTTENELLKWVEDLAKVESNCIGFVPRIAYKQALARERLMIVADGEELVGFAFWGRGRQELKDSISIYQMAVVNTHRRLKYGIDLLRGISHHPATYDRQFFRCTCRQGIAANDFWRHIGLTHVATKVQTGERGWHSNLYIGPIRPTEMLPLKLQPPQISLPIRLSRG